MVVAKAAQQSTSSSTNLDSHRLPKMMNLMAYHGHTPTCETEQTSERVHDFELGLHIAALFAILLTSTFGIDHANSPSEI
jgi:hypothetical protein